jgi:hypothetical protein
MSIQQQLRSGFMPSESLLLDAAKLIDELQAKLDKAEATIDELHGRLRSASDHAERELQERLK